MSIEEASCHSSQGFERQIRTKPFSVREDGDQPIRIRTMQDIDDENMNVGDKETNPDSDSEQGWTGFYEQEKVGETNERNFIRENEDSMFTTSPQQQSDPVSNSQNSHSSQKSSQSLLDDLSESMMQSSPDIDEEFRDTDLENKEKFTMLQKFFSTLSKGELEIQYKWRGDKVTENVNRKRAKMLDQMVKYLLETVFPGANDASYQNIIDRAFNANCGSIMLDKIIESYNNAQSKQVKRFLIMELTLVKKFKELQEVLPDLTIHQYKAAKKLVKQAGLSKLPEPEYKNITRNRRDYDSTVYFVEFFSNFVRVIYKV